MNKGYAFGFLLVLLVLILGFYVAYTSFVSGREAWRAQRPLESDAQEVEATGGPATGPSLEITPTRGIIPTGSLEISPVLTQGITTTLTITLAPGTATPGQPGEETAAVPTPMPPTAPTGQPAQTAAPAELPPATPTAPAEGSGTPQAPPPTPVPLAAYQFRLAGPPAANADYPICCYIYGTVQDAAGNGLEGISVQVANEWNPPIVAITKGGDERGKYDVPINASVVNWEIALVDAAGNQISTKVQIQFDANAANGYRVDWQRTY